MSLNLCFLKRRTFTGWFALSVLFLPRQVILSAQKEEKKASKQRKRESILRLPRQKIGLIGFLLAFVANTFLARKN